MDARGLDRCIGASVRSPTRAAREIVESLAEGLRRHVSDVRRLVPAADDPPGRRGRR
jgi:hypothetical protein